MTNTPVVYEVTATVESELREAYERFMTELHIPELLRTRHFMRASFERSEGGRYRARYVASSREALNSYLADDAPRLRKEFAEHFPDGIELSREEWTTLRNF